MKRQVLFSVGDNLNETSSLIFYENMLSSFFFTHQIKV